MQRKAYSVFVLPDDLSQVMRPTTRKGRDRFHDVISLGIIADSEKDFRQFRTSQSAQG